MQLLTPPMTSHPTTVAITVCARKNGAAQTAKQVSGSCRQDDTHSTFAYLRTSSRSMSLRSKVSLIRMIQLSSAICFTLCCVPSNRYERASSGCDISHAFCNLPQ